LSGIEMPPQQLVEALSVQERNGVPTHRSGPQPDIPALNSLALRSLALLFDEKEKLFSQRATLTEEGIHRERTSHRHTIIALLGLQRLAESGGTLPFDVAAIREVILGDASRVRSVGDLGLLTWFTAVCAPERLGILFKQFDFGKALDTYADGRQACTRQLAWFLAGIAHAELACPGTLPDLTDIAVETYHLLQNNQSEEGIFGHAAFSRFLRDAFCNRFGTFADQIYAIYALSTFARAFEIEEPLGSALACANSLCALQGEMGQWWSLYDKRRGCIVNRYPVFSAHQDGTAPAALLALGEVTSQSFHKPIWKGLSWIAGANELRQDLRSLDRALIWDSIGPRRRVVKYWEAALSFMGIFREPQVESLRIRYEACPDHFGWLLYAFGKFGLPKVDIAADASTTH
jgi:hypothetical protein